MHKIKLILGSKSPRRKELISKINLPFEVRTKEMEEIYPDSIPSEEVASYLANLKAGPLKETILGDEILLTSDTIVVINDEILGKPKNKEEAFSMLTKLSNCTHKVITGVNLFSLEKEVNFSTTTEVTFVELSKDEINYYIDNYSPFDKAGSYGIQDWIGLIGVKKIEGCYYNVMGLPVNEIYKRLASFQDVKTKNKIKLSLLIRRL